MSGTGTFARPSNSPRRHGVTQDAIISEPLRASVPPWCINNCEWDGRADVPVLRSGFFPWMPPVKTSRQSIVTSKKPHAHNVRHATIFPDDWLRVTSHPSRTIMASHNTYMTTKPGANRSTGVEVARDFQARQTPANIPNVNSGTEPTTAHQFIRPSRSKL